MFILLQLYLITKLYTFVLEAVDVVTYIVYIIISDTLFPTERSRAPAVKTFPTTSGPAAKTTGKCYVMW